MELLYYYLAMIVIPTFLALKELPERLRSLHRGCRGFLYSPVAFTVGLFTLVIAEYAAEALPFLKWGLLGYNIITLPLMEGSADAGALGLTGQILSFAFLLISILTIMLSNFWEEKYFRDSYKLVVIWTFIHLIMGTTLYALPSIFCQGLIFKHVYDKYSVDHSYAAHFGTNIMLISLAFLLSC